MNEASVNIRHLSYLVKWQASDSVLTITIRRTGFLNRHWHTFIWRLEHSPGPSDIYESAVARSGTLHLPNIFVRLLARLLGMRFILSLGELPAPTETSRLDAFLGKNHGVDTVVFRNRYPGGSRYIDMPLEILKRIAEQGVAPYVAQGAPSGER